MSAFGQLMQLHARQARAFGRVHTVAYKVHRMMADMSVPVLAAWAAAEPQDRALAGGGTILAWG